MATYTSSYRRSQEDKLAGRIEKFITNCLPLLTKVFFYWE